MSEWDVAALQQALERWDAGALHDRCYELGGVRQPHYLAQQIAEACMRRHRRPEAPETPEVESDLDDDEDPASQASDDEEDREDESSSSDDDSDSATSNAGEESPSQDWSELESMMSRRQTERDALLTMLGNVLSDSASESSSVCSELPSEAELEIEFPPPLPEIEEEDLRPAWPYPHGQKGADAFSLCVCPITHEVMREPVVAADGMTYELEAIRRWMMTCENGPTSPITNQPMATDVLFPNHAIRSLISTLLDVTKGVPGASSTATTTVAHQPCKRPSSGASKCSREADAKGNKTLMASRNPGRNPWLSRGGNPAATWGPDPGALERTTPLRVSLGLPRISNSRGDRGGATGSTPAPRWPSA
mmetsp:Transcript_37734/g.98832  ORF Transcript_37734/g.98832 Transcript_37734/m.98832 type:complete len:364 (-) Transcript_37734:178-1269(-)